MVVDFLVYLQPCTSGDSYGQLENAEKGHQEGNMDSKVPETNIHTSNSYPRESMNIKHTRKLLNVSNMIFPLGITILLA